MDKALIAQLGERQTEDLKAPCSIHGQSNLAFRENAQEWIVVIAGRVSFR